MLVKEVWGYNGTSAPYLKLPYSYPAHCEKTDLHSQLNSALKEKFLLKKLTTSRNGR